MQQRSILVVDDELLIRDLLYDFLSGRGWHVQVADSAERALQETGKQNYDVVLADIKLPEMSGLELAGQFKAAHRLQPVVLMTGYPSVESAVQALRLKADDYITKPFNIHALAKRLESIAPGEPRDADGGNV